MTLGDRCDEIVRLIDETLAGMTTPVPPRRRRPTVATPGTATPFPVRRSADGSTAGDPGPTAA